jgi:hypothetical protein
MKSLNQTVRRAVLTAAVTGLLAAVIGGVSLAHAGGSAAADTTFTLNEAHAGAQFVDVTHTPAGGPGDELILRSVLHNQAGDRVGSLNVVCVVVLANQLECQGTYRLQGGTITGTAMVPKDENSTAPVRIAITGGTGRYDHARGQIITTPTSPTTDQSVVDLD